MRRLITSTRHAGKANVCYRACAKLAGEANASHARHATSTSVSPATAARIVATLAALICLLFAYTGCAAEPASDEGVNGIPSTPYSQSADAPNQSPSSPQGASTFAANLPDADAAAAQTAQPLVIAESGWWAKDGYVHYGLTVRNPNTSVAATGIMVRATLFDGSGTALGSYDSMLALVGAGETVGFAGEAGDGLVPARVEFALIPESITWKDGETASMPFLIESYTEQDKLYFRYEITGSISNVTDAYESTANLYVLLRGDAGEILAGYTGAAYRIKAQRTKDFLITLHSAPDHASTEVYVQPT